LRKRYWGQHLWARGYFCATLGAVDEQTVLQYIKNGFSRQLLNPPFPRDAGPEPLWIWGASASERS